jgi:hypothetical protein
MEDTYMKFLKISTILIWSSHYKQLANWYQTIFGLTLIEEIKHPNDTGRLFDFPGGGTRIWIGKHGDIKGNNKDSLRIMFNITVDSIDEIYKYLKSKRIKFIATPFKAPIFDKWFITFSDPEGNTIQCIGNK